MHHQRLERLDRPPDPRSSVLSSSSPRSEHQVGALRRFKRGISRSETIATPDRSTISRDYADARPCRWLNLNSYGLGGKVLDRIDIDLVDPIKGPARGSTKSPCDKAANRRRRQKRATEHDHRIFYLGEIDLTCDQFGSLLHPNGTNQVTRCLDPSALGELYAMD
jgi:hypothetical protein